MLHSLRLALLSCLCYFLPQQATADDSPTQLAVWANEAIVATYTYDAQHFIARQKEIAHYFTSDGWINYSKAFDGSNLLASVQKNNYQVSAVATMPPVIKTLHPHYWQATMPLLVIYKNPQYQQKQTLEITLEFTTAPSGQGVRGLGITSLQSKVIKPMCRCAPDA